MRFNPVARLDPGQVTDDRYNHAFAQWLVRRGVAGVPPNHGPGVLPFDAMRYWSAYQTLDMLRKAALMRQFNATKGF